jgi:putative tryptophan/tyrosine transport system substrate-binding protein
MRRREFITLLGGAAAAWPLAASAQQRAMPMIGFLSLRSPEDSGKSLAAFRGGLAEGGFLEGQNVAIEYRWGRGQYDLMQPLTADLVVRQVALIVAVNPPAALAAKAATSTIPIVFSIGVDPVTSGIVASFNRPGGNATGVYSLTSTLEAKRLELLHEVVPNAAVIAVLVNPNFSETERQLKEAQEAARVLGLKLLVLQAGSESEIHAAFATLVKQRVGALLVAADPFFYLQRGQFITLVARHAIPAIYSFPEFVTDGGLMSYGVSSVDAYHLAGIYTGRILKGARPADLPVQQSTKVELVLNVKTARTLGLGFPITLLGRADEVIE